MTDNWPLASQAFMQGCSADPELPSDRCLGSAGLEDPHQGGAEAFPSPLLVPLEAGRGLMDGMCLGLGEVDPGASHVRDNTLGYDLTQPPGSVRVSPYQKEREMQSRSATRKYQISLPNGRLVTRSTKSKEYRFVVIGQVEKWNESGAWEWGALRWSETARAAQTAAAGFDQKPHMRNVQVLSLEVA